MLLAAYSPLRAPEWIPVLCGLAAAGVALVALTGIACAVGDHDDRREAPQASLAAVATQAEALAHRYPEHRVDGLEERYLEPERYWDMVGSIVDRAPDRLRVDEVGRSVEARPLRRVDFGGGETAVLLWSQMHGDESTASRALADVLDYLADRPDDELVLRLERRLAVTVVPVLNPDGTARFRRHNAVGIDINRDARALATPEARVLKAVRDAVEPDWAFNLHDQDVRTRLGDTDRDVQIALLAPPPGEGETSDAHRRAQHLAALLVGAVHPVVGDAVARYDDDFNPRAFGDLMTRWGAATVLIESGGSLDDPHKERLRMANFVAILAALDAIATGRWDDADPDVYAALPENARGAADLILRGGSVVLPGGAPVRADVAIEYDDSLTRSGGRIAEIGDLADRNALREVDVSGLYYRPASTTLVGPRLIDDAGPGRLLAPGVRATGVLSRDVEGRQVVWRLEEGRLERVAPDSSR